MSLLGNILWIIFGGIIIFFEYLIAGVLMMITIIGIPFGLQAFKLALASLAPFGKEVRPTASSYSGFSTLMNLLWILLGGFWIAVTHLALGLVLCITIIGIPFGLQHFKLMRLSLTPFGAGFS